MEGTPEWKEGVFHDSANDGEQEREQEREPEKLGSTQKEDEMEGADENERSTPSSPPPPSAPQSTSSGTLYLILIQVMSRGLTFIGNQVLLRFLSPELLGLSVQLELFSVFVLYFSRESLRVALQRAPQVSSSTDGKNSSVAKSKSEESQAIVNFSYLAIAIGLPLTLVTGYLYLHNASSTASSIPSFTFALQLYALATIIELLAEPSFVILQQRLLYKNRARSETLAAISKCLAACVVAFVLQDYGQPPSVMPAAIGQLCYALVLVCEYAATAFPIARSDGFSMSIKTLANTPEYLWFRFSKSLISLAATLYGQSVFKQILTQGDAYILGFFASLSDQGAFALASNYGGLIARLFFQPIEEDSRNVFGRLLAGISVAQRKPEDVTVALDRLVNICHIYGIIAVGSCCFLDQALPVMVKLVIGRAWWTPEISQILTTYCYYIPFIGFNGILDAFVTSVATPAQLGTQSFWMMAFTGIYAAAAYVSLHVLGLGAKGLVLANIVNMTLRISWSVVFINKYIKAYDGRLVGSFKQKRNGSFAWMDAMPSVTTIACGAGIAIGLRTGMSQATNTTQSLQLLVGSGALLGVAILVCEINFITKNASQMLPHRAAKMTEALERKVRRLFTVRKAGWTLNGRPVVRKNKGDKYQRSS